MTLQPGDRFPELTLDSLDGGDARGEGQRSLAAIGHTRYSTTGSNTLPNVQPVHARGDLGELMLGHNGNLTNAPWLRDEPAVYDYLIDADENSHLLSTPSHNLRAAREADIEQFTEPCFGVLHRPRSGFFSSRRIFCAAS